MFSKDTNLVFWTLPSVEPNLTMLSLLLGMEHKTELIIGSSEIHGAQHGEMAGTSSLLQLTKTRVSVAVKSKTSLQLLIESIYMARNNFVNIADVAITSPIIKLIPKSR